MRGAICLKTTVGLSTITVDTEGSPGFAGAVLYAKYQTEKDVRKLLKLGDLYELHEKTNPVDNLGHYILKEKEKVVEIRLQEGVCISKYRDVRQVEGSIIKRKSEIKPRIYKNPKVAYICEGVDYVYVFDVKTSRWVTYGCDMRTNEFGQLKINYLLYIKNLVYREDISALSETEKNRLSYIR